MPIVCDMPYVVARTTSTMFQSERMKWDCTCPDFLKRNKACKHIYFIVYKVLRFDRDQTDYSKAAHHQDCWEFALKRFENKEHDTDVPEDILKAYNKLREIKKRKTEEITPQGLQDGQRNYVGEDCGICMEEMKLDEQVIYCNKVCGRSVHTDCFVKWSSHHKSPTCVYCRSTIVTNEEYGSTDTYLKIQT